MALLSAYEDFCTRTLAAVHGAWKQLEFVSSLKGEKGQYEHWGMKYTYGPVQANRAIAQAHTDLFQKVLETSISTLDGEVEKLDTKGASRITAENHVPENSAACSKEHFRYISTALNLLAESRSSHRAA